MRSSLNGYDHIIRDFDYGSCEVCPCSTLGCRIVVTYVRVEIRKYPNRRYLPERHNYDS